MIQRTRDIGDEPLLVLRVDSAEKIALAAGDALESLGVNAQGLTGRGLEAAFGPNEEVLAAAREALLGRPAQRAIEVEGRTVLVRAEPAADGSAGCLVVLRDVTEHLATTRALETSEARRAESERVAHVGSWEWDPVQNKVTWSDELYRIYGIEPGEFDGTYEAFLARVHPEDHAVTHDVIFGAFRSLDRFVYDHRVVRGDGAVRTLHTVGEVIADAAGKPVRMLGCCWDVTESREARARLLRSHSLLEATLDSTEDGIFVVDLEGRVVTVNRRALELWELPASLAEGGLVLELVEHVKRRLADPEAFVRRERELLADRETVCVDTIFFKDGRIFERYSQPQRLEGAVIGRVCSFRDVTERERLLRRFMFLSDATRLLASLDVEQALEAVARLALPLLGTACAIDFFVEGGGPRRLLSLSLPTAEPVSIELPRTVLTGSSAHFDQGSRSCLAVPLTVRGDVVGALTFLSASDRPFGPFHLDLAEELARRASLSVANARLHRQSEAALRARDEFLAVASHELRGPAAALHLAVQNLLAARDPDATPKLVRVIERAERRLARFVDELFDVTALRNGQLRLELEEVDAGAVAREVVSRLAPDLTRSGSTLSMVTHGDLVGMWDRSRVEQLVANLLANAIKFGLGKPIEVRVTGDENVLRLAVSDQGVGIPRDRQEAIFQPFERVTTGRHYGGLGLGLFVSKTIVDGLGGTIRVTSEVDHGSTFVVELPKARKR